MQQLQIFNTICNFKLP